MSDLYAISPLRGDQPVLAGVLPGLTPLVDADRVAEVVHVPADDVHMYRHQSFVNRPAQCLRWWIVEVVNEIGRCVARVERVIVSERAGNSHPSALGP